MSNGSGVSRGDRNRNARLGRLRELVPVTNAIVGIDLADCKQMVVVTDHDSKVQARRTFRCRAWALGAALDWAAGRAAAKGFAQVTVARADRAPLAGAGQLAADRGMPFVCVQPMVTPWARRNYAGGPAGRPQWVDGRPYPAWAYSITPSAMPAGARFMISVGPGPGTKYQWFDWALVPAGVHVTCGLSVPPVVG